MRGEVGKRGGRNNTTCWGSEQDLSGSGIVHSPEERRGRDVELEIRSDLDKCTSLICI